MVDGNEEIISEDEVKALPSAVRRITLKDFDLPAISRALAEFDVSLSDLDGAAVAVFDHGAAPPGYSDRQLRFDNLAERLDNGFGPALLSNGANCVRDRLSSIGPFALFISSWYFSQGSRLSNIKRRLASRPTGSLERAMSGKETSG